MVCSRQFGGARQEPSPRVGARGALTAGTYADGSAQATVPAKRTNWLKRGLSGNEDGEFMVLSQRPKLRRERHPHRAAIQI